MVLDSRPRRGRAVTLACCIALVVSSGYDAVARRPQQEPRDTPSPAPQVGTSRIAGQVVAADTGAPVKRAMVSIVGTSLSRVEGGRSSVGGGAMVRLTQARGGFTSGSFAPRTTDEAGRFEFPDLAAGTYQIMVTPRSGFVRTPRPQPVEVGDGETASIAIRLERTGAITGRVLDEGGDPLARVRVSAFRRQRLAGRRLMPTGSGSSTDDLGQFRLFDLPPGEYLVSASDTSYNYGPPDAPGPREGYAPTYFPGSASVDAARPVAVKSAQETPGIEFSLLRVTMGRITGTVRDSTGQVVTSRTSVSISRRGRDEMAFNRGSSVRPDGSFVIQEVPPGEYYLAASVSLGDGPNALREGAYLPLSVNGNELTVDIQTNKGATVRGRVIVEGTPPPPPAGVAEMPVGANRITVSARPAMTAAGPGMAMGMSRPVNPGEDGAFELTGLRGPLLLTAFGPRMALRSVTIGADDLTARPMEFKGSERVSNVTIVLTHDVGTLDGVVTDDRGTPLPGATVIVFPEDSSRWFPGSPFVHYSRTMPAAPTAIPRPPQTLPVPGTPAAPGRMLEPGRFAALGLLPGRYLVAAIDPAQTQGIPQMDEETLERLRPHAVLATIAAGSTANVQLRALRMF
jgi:Carboxypeptidase regulatory-like domain